MDNPEDQGGSAPPAKKQKTSIFGFSQLPTSGAAFQSPLFTPTTNSKIFGSAWTGLPPKTNTAPANPFILQESITIDSEGDLYLEVRESHIFQVDSRMLCRCSPVFKAMLTGPWLESQPTEGKWTIKLPEDSPRGLEVLLNIVHGRFDMVPASLEGDYLFDVCVEADKRDMVKVLRPWSKVWGMKLGLDPYSRLLTDLFTSWVLGWGDIYAKLIMHMVRNCYIRGPGSVQVILRLTPGSNLQFFDLNQTLQGYAHAKSTGFMGKSANEPRSPIEPHISKGISLSIATYF